MKKNNFLTHASAAIIVCLLSGLIYVTVQQSYRNAANDPQLQVARDICERLEKGNPAKMYISGDSIDISKSRALFKILFDSLGTPLRSTGLLDNQLPGMPKGVFDYTRSHGEDILTWQPRRGVRMAMVVEKIASPGTGFIAVGRSLTETEKRVRQLTNMILIGWLACLGVILLHWIFIRSKND